MDNQPGKQPFTDTPSKLPDSVDKSAGNFAAVAPKQFTPEKGHDTIGVVAAFTGVLD